MTAQEGLTEEARSMLVNDIHVLVTELNAKMKEASEHGLEVRASSDTTLQMLGRATVYPTITIRILAEIR